MNIVERRKVQREDIQVDSKILIEIEGRADNEGTVDVLSLKSSVEAVESDGTMLVQMPMHKGGFYLLPRNSPFLVYTFSGQRMYSFTAIFLGQAQKDGLVYARLRKVSAVLPSQRRSCYRLQTHKPIKIDRLKIDESGFIQTHSQTAGQMINLSDSGMLFNSDENIPKDEIIGITFTLEENSEEIMIDGKVLRTEKIANAVYKFRTAISFHGTKTRQKDYFYKYIVDKQREKIKR